MLLSLQRSGDGRLRSWLSTIRRRRDRDALWRPDEFGDVRALWNRGHRDGARLGGVTLAVTAGNTSSATWTLTNTDPSAIFLNRILSVSIHLTFSGVSLFDSGSIPSTPDSGPGAPGVVYLSGVAIGGATNLLPWSDVSNLGDMYYAVDFTLLDGGLTAGLSTSFSTDTDVIGVPEPATIPILAASLALGAIVCRLRLML